MAFSSTTGSTAGGLPGYRTDWNAAYGGKPVVPSPGETSRTAISTNIGNLGQLYNLAQGVNPFQQEQLLGQYEAAIPGYGTLTEAAAGNIAEELAGQVPSDVVNEIVQNAAERGILTGSVGSPNANAALLRALGLTSLGMKQTGQAGLLAMTQAAPIAAPMDITRMFVTPEEQQQAQLAANIYASAPVPAAAAEAARRAAQIPGLSPPGGKTALGPSSVGGSFGKQGYQFPEPSYPSTGISGAYPENIPMPVDPYAEWYKWASGIPVGYGKGTTTFGEPTESLISPSDELSFPPLGDYASQLFGPMPSFDYSAGDFNPVGPMPIGVDFSTSGF